VVILSNGLLHPGKGIDLVLRALPAVVKHHPEVGGAPTRRHSAVPRSAAKGSPRMPLGSVRLAWPAFSMPLLPAGPAPARRIISHNQLRCPPPAPLTFFPAYARCCTWSWAGRTPAVA
jgi:hypothetical protein